MNDRLAPGNFCRARQVVMDIVDYFRFIAALSVVLGLIAGCAYVVRRFGLTPRVTTGSNRRVRVVEISTVDARRQVVLLRRDGVEHLVLLGPTGDVVVETGIAVPPAIANEDPCPRASNIVVPWPRFAQALRRLTERPA